MKIREGISCHVHVLQNLCPIRSPVVIFMCSRIYAQSGHLLSSSCAPESMPNLVTCCHLHVLQNLCPIRSPVVIFMCSRIYAQSGHLLSSSNYLKCWNHNDKGSLERIKIGITFIFRFHCRPIQIVVFVPVGISSFLQQNKHWHPTKPAEHVIRKMKGLQERTQQFELDDSETWK